MRCEDLKQLLKDMIRVSKGTPMRTMKISYKTTNLCQEMV